MISVTPARRALVTRSMATPTAIRHAKFTFSGVIGDCASRRGITESTSDPSGSIGRVYHRACGARSRLGLTETQGLARGGWRYLQGHAGARRGDAGARGNGIPPRHE